MLELFFEVVVRGVLQAIGWAVLKVVTFGGLSRLPRGRHHP